MKKYVIRGGNLLEGEVRVSGGKNAAVAIIPAALLVNGVCIIENVPVVNDVILLTEIMAEMGAKVSFLDKTTLRIDSTEIHTCAAVSELVRKMRASYYLIGALLGRFGKAQVGLPGGCDFGVRPIDYHIRGFEALGATVSIEHGIVNAFAENGVKGASMSLDFPSVGATINIMMAAVLAQGTTIIENAGKEPHIVDIANFLNAMGAEIRGAGTDTIKIKGVSELHSGRYEIIPDQIEAGTYMVAAAAVGGKVKVTNVIPKHLESISAKLEEIGVNVEEDDDFITVSRAPGQAMNKVNVKTLPYPGFPTDMQPQIATLLCLANGTSIVTEGIYEHRFKYVDELRRMGAKMNVDGRVCVISGIDHFTGASVCACDLRAGVSLVIAGLCAEGMTEITNVHLIERGYEDIVEKLRGLGASIGVVDDESQTAENAGINAG